MGDGQEDLRHHLKEDLHADQNEQRPAPEDQDASGVETLSPVTLPHQNRKERVDQGRGEQRNDDALFLIRQAVLIVVLVFWIDRVAGHVLIPVYIK